MVTITNGVKSFRVTAGAVKVYEGMGFRVATDEELQEMEHVEQEQGNCDSSVSREDADDKGNASVEGDEMDAKDIAFIEELLEKPVSQWSSEEMKDFVKIKGIDTSSAQKASQVRSIIKAYLEEEQKRGM